MPISSATLWVFFKHCVVRESFKSEFFSTTERQQFLNYISWILQDLGIFICMFLHSFLVIFKHCEAIKVTWCICQPSFYWWWSRDFLPHFICSGTISKALGIVVVGFFLSSSKAASGSDFKDLVFFETLWGQLTLKMNQQLALVMVL